MFRNSSEGKKLCMVLIWASWCNTDLSELMLCCALCTLLILILHYTLEEVKFIQHWYEACIAGVVVITCRETTEGIEMSVISAEGERPSMTPPVQCSSRNSVVDGNSRRGSTRRPLPAADSMDYINKLVGDDITHSSRKHNSSHGQ